MRSRRHGRWWTLGGITFLTLFSAVACGGAFSSSNDERGDGGGPDTGALEAASSSDAAAGDADPSDARARDTGASDAGPPRLVAFVTAVGYADITTVASADTKCRAEAEGRLTGTFVAWFSSAVAAAPSRLVDSKGMPVDGPWFRVDGLRIAATRSALLATSSVPLENALTLTATGKVMGGAVWTGTHADGAIGSLCPAGANPTTGAANQVGPAWTEQTFFTATCANTSLALYCFQVE